MGTSNSALEFDTYPANRIMKLCLLAIALIAGVIAEPESKPSDPYDDGYYHYGKGHDQGTYYDFGRGVHVDSLGFTYLRKRSADAEPESNPEPDSYVVGYYPYGNGYALGNYFGYGGYYYLGKRSADAEPESNPKSDPYLVGYYPYGNGYALGHYLGYGGYHYLGKRSADAEPESNPKSDPYLVGYYP